MKLTAEIIKEFFAELREDGYDQYLKYPLEEIERAALCWIEHEEAERKKAGEPPELSAMTREQSINRDETIAVAICLGWPLLNLVLRMLTQ